MRFQMNQNSSLSHVLSGFPRRKLKRLAILFFSFQKKWTEQNPGFEQSDFADCGSENQHG